MTINLAVGDAAKLDEQLAAIVMKLNAQRRQPVLIFNQYDGDGCPSAFIVGTAELHARTGKDKPFISLLTPGLVYQLKNRLWVPDRSNPWGRNFFPERERSYIAIGLNEIIQTLHSKLQYQGELPFKG